MADPLHIFYYLFFFFVIFLNFFIISLEYQTKIREPCDMKQNPYNGIMCIGDRRGVVSMFSPNTSQPLVKMLCHKSSISSLAIQKDGYYMVTTGNDGLMKVWDLRTYKKVYDYWTPKQSKTIDISQRNLLAVSNGNLLMVIQNLNKICNFQKVWKDWYLNKQKIPYMKQEIFENGQINDLKFAPYEDFLGVGLDIGEF